MTTLYSFVILSQKFQDLENAEHMRERLLLSVLTVNSGIDLTIVYAAINELQHTVRK